MVGSAAEYATSRGAVPNISELIDLEHGLLSTQLYTEPNIFRAEIKNIFHRTWLYVGHETAVEVPGDYVLLTLGLEPCILCRDQEGKLHVFQNRCAHRGATVCQDVCGNARYFRCGYHGWTFRNNGDLVGAPSRGGYPSFNSRDWHLGELPRVDSYRGFIFASFSSGVPSLTEHLRPVIPYLDRFIDQCSPFAMAAMNGTQTLAYNSNWKAQLENAPDTYHAHSTHKSFVDILKGRIGEVGRMYDPDDPNSVSLSFVHGHSVIDRKDRQRASEAGGRVWNLRKRLETSPGASRLIAAVLRDRPEDGERLLATAGGVGQVLTIFPNLILNGIHIREIVPVTVNRTEVRNTVMNPRGAPSELLELRLRTHEFFYGPAAFAAPDDYEMFERTQLGYAAGIPQWLTVSRGLHRQTNGSDGETIAHGSDEATIRNQYREWGRLMSEPLGDNPVHVAGLDLADRGEPIGLGQ